jgi:hypothetical protein
MRKRYIVRASVTVIALAIVLGAVYALLVPGLSSARIEPPAAETVVATNQSVPAAAKVSANPLGADPADVTAGRDLHRQKCELCHAYDGSGKTNLGGGEYPRPPALRSAAVMAMPDGEIFYHIRSRCCSTTATGLTTEQANGNLFDGHISTTTGREGGQPVHSPISRSYDSSSSRVFLE